MRAKLANLGALSTPALVLGRVEDVLLCVLKLLAAQHDTVGPHAVIPGRPAHQRAHNRSGNARWEPGVDDQTRALAGSAVAAPAGISSGFGAAVVPGWRIPASLIRFSISALIATIRVLPVAILLRKRRNSPFIAAKCD